MSNLCQFVLKHGGKVHPLTIPPNLYRKGHFTTLMNPSICLHNDELYINLRCTNYALWMSRSVFYPSSPLVYTNEDHDCHLRTTNLICKWVDGQLIFVGEVKPIYHEPQWEFIGLEDARLISEDGQLKIIGCVRDRDDIGTSRMEQWTLDDDLNVVDEKRFDSLGFGYCEKNHVPVVGTNELYTDFKKGWVQSRETEEIFEVRTLISNDLRGSSQIIPIGLSTNKLPIWLGISHTTICHRPAVICKGEKDATYLHQFVGYLDHVGMKQLTKDFTFMGSDIEFCNGMCIVGDTIYITFADMDNAAYMIETNVETLAKFIKENERHTNLSK